MPHFHLRYNEPNRKREVRFNIRYERENEAVRASGVTNANRYPDERGYYDVVDCDNADCERRTKPTRPIVPWEFR